MSKQSITSMSSFQVTVPEIVKRTETGFQQALLVENCLSSYLSELANNREQLLFCYQGKNTNSE